MRSVWVRATSAICLVAGLALGSVVLAACSSDGGREGAVAARHGCTDDELGLALAAVADAPDTAPGVDTPYAIDSAGTLTWYAASLDDLTALATPTSDQRYLYVLSSEARPDRSISLHYVDVAVDANGEPTSCENVSSTLTFESTTESAGHAYNLELVGSTTRLLPHTGDLIVLDS